MLGSAEPEHWYLQKVCVCMAIPHLYSPNHSTDFDETHTKPEVWANVGLNGLDTIVKNFKNRSYSLSKN